MKLLITGTSKGIGKALALYYLRQGSIVFGISRTFDAELDTYETLNFSHRTWRILKM